MPSYYGFDARSNLNRASGNWTYYSSLFGDDKNPINQQLLSALNTKLEYASNRNNIASYFYNLANSELTKEKALLAEVFGNSITGSYSEKDKSIGKEIIEAVNYALRSKDIFERNLRLLKVKKGNKQAISYFSTYLQGILNSEEWRNDYEKILATCIQDETFENACSTAFEALLDKTVKQALHKALITAQDNGSYLDPNLQNAYKNIMQEINNGTEMGNRFVNSLIDIYKLRELGQSLVDRASTSTTDLKNFYQQKFSSLGSKYSIHTRGGQASEHLTQIAISNAISQFNGVQGGNDSIQFSVKSTGESNQKADTIVTINMQTDWVDKWLNDNQFGTREKDVLALEQFNERLSKIKNGFVIYVNSKNYSIDSDYFNDNKGFQTEKALKLENFAAAIDNLNVIGDSYALINLAMQLPQGAILDSKKEEVSKAFARAIAAFLFDDFSVIGQEQTGAQSIHLLDLNGIFIPLSFYFNILAETFNSIKSAKNYQSLVDVSIKPAGKIIFEGPKGISGWKQVYEKYGVTSKEAWMKQRDYTLANTTITVHFLQNLRKVMNDTFKI